MTFTRCYIVTDDARARNVAYVAYETGKVFVRTVASPRSSSFGPSAVRVEFISEEAWMKPKKMF